MMVCVFGCARPLRLNQRRQVTAVTETGRQARAGVRRVAWPALCW